MAYPAVRTTKEDDNVVFSFLRRQLFTSDQPEALERESFLHSTSEPRENDWPTDLGLICNFPFSGEGPRETLNPTSQKQLKIVHQYYTEKGTQSTGESNKSGLETLQGRITKLAF